MNAASFVPEDLWEVLEPVLPKALGCDSGTPCWRRLRDWQVAGVWHRLHKTLLNWLGDAAAID
jgi:hypothetical protein